MSEPPFRPSDLIESINDPAVRRGPHVGDWAWTIVKHRGHMITYLKPDALVLVLSVEKINNDAEVFGDRWRITALEFESDNVLQSLWSAQSWRGCWKLVASGI